MNYTLETFLAVHEETTVVGAATKLGIVPTAVTQRIKSLEEECVIRTKAPTQFGSFRPGNSVEGARLIRFIPPGSLPSI